ncbi:PREDICTED: protein IQ-DOMAIN 31-like [Tarenaya hassleriana]|uniref:protein IQ-DOMAIN 31-like n=1 Tax=Tarenaya hassleriana TaxID=28532 RepID=UPI00053C3627|nr:PREDICTED: protein IQ-DOMAIN 31-like [Tarenaya hassleriana]XP_010538073.1 PREDICTED: protein IQ-DOMAIN 31-like [Tarenaya hassleriana]XP_010538074.1 PREDICTED: protein IQ-DOMAIN 31-like [Tarenaya hassleriana]XP_010538076.1 PREDICTED: protein IQ-DOMAIN 31-like [Tarenaya hassleriana]XP_010538077.1 PREDICTED: protein IQ-DOMAIN 31-like [Tarenaya hassleriana]XP_019058018.1 PREDICTED: protein IQ-DOMAIN 31-like [Tarenaya hassleriana]
MGKSARWIKNVLLGKKSSKSSGSKGKQRVLNEKEVLITAKIEESDTVSDLPSIPNVVSNMADASSGMLETVNMGAEKVSDNEIQVHHEGQVTDFEGADPIPDNSLSDEEKIQQENAATAVQAAFRGYLARRAFWALKGIIRLQALIRGHLVRRQAVAALCCVMGIVRLQAFARGREVRHSDIGVEVQSKCRLQSPLENKLADPVDTHTYLGITKLTSNTFALKLLASSPKVMPFHFHYDSSDPNSVSNWLEIWSASRFWKPVAQPKKALVRKTQKKFANNNSQSEAEAVRSKKSVRKVPAANLDNPSVQTSFEIEKPKRNFRKVPSQSVEPPAVDNPQSELEKVKRSLRKVHNPVVENSIQPQLDPQVEAEKPKLAVEKPPESSSSPPPPVHEPLTALDMEEPMNANASDGETKQEMSETVHSPAPLEAIEVLESSWVNQVDQLDDNPAVETKPLMVKKTKEDKVPKLNNQENSADKESQRSGKKGSVNAKSERQESNGNQMNTTIPSYMQATQSAKAKLRLQGSPRSAGQDGTEKNNVVTRRHSLPSPLNSRVTSHSPRTARATNSGGKTSSKNEKPLLASREVNGKTTQVEWKR